MLILTTIAFMVATFCVVIVALKKRIKSASDKIC
jgi:hypothetical protein